MPPGTHTGAVDRKLGGRRSDALNSCPHGLPEGRSRSGGLTHGGHPEDPDLVRRGLRGGDRRGSIGPMAVCPHQESGTELG